MNMIEGGRITTKTPSWLCQFLGFRFIGGVMWKFMEHLNIMGVILLY